MREFITNFQKKHGQQVPMPKIYGDEDSSDDEGLELADGTKVGKKTTGSARDGSGPSTSGEGAGRSGGRKRGRDDDDDDDDPNKCRKTGDEGEQPLRPLVARKEPRKKGTAYPPINRKLPALYISRPKERTLLGHRMLDWTPEQKRKIHEARMQGRLVKPHQVQSGDCGSARHSPLPKDLSTAHPEIAFPEVGEGDRPGLQDRPAVPVSGDTVSPGSSGGLPGQAV